MRKYILLIIAAMFIFDNVLLSQTRKGGPEEFNPDTTFIFQSPRPLLTFEEAKSSVNGAWGGDLIFSVSGFGAGLFINHHFSDNLMGFVSLYISGARNTDEFELWDIQRGEWRVPNKVNRLFMFPFTFGLKHYLFSDELTDSFRPYIHGGFGPTFILATPYEKDFFEAFSYSTWYTKPGGFLGIGAYFGTAGNAVTGLNIRYYYIPFGGDGLESIKDLPIKDFGGIFISLSIGLEY